MIRAPVIFLSFFFFFFFFFFFSPGFFFGGGGGGGGQGEGAESVLFLSWSCTNCSRHQAVSPALQPVLAVVQLGYFAARHLPVVRAHKLARAFIDWPVECCERKT